MADLVVTAQGQQWRLDPTRTYTLGRKQDADIVVPGNLVSSRHATLAHANGAWTITDEGSTNGTFVDGRPVTTVPLTPGLAIMVGGATDGVRLDVSEAPVPSAAPTSPTASQPATVPPPPPPPAAPPVAPAPAGSPVAAAAQQGGWQPPPPPSQAGAVSWQETRAKSRKTRNLLMFIGGGLLAVVLAVVLVLTLTVFNDPGETTAKKPGLGGGEKGKASVPVEGPIGADVDGDKKGDIVVGDYGKDPVPYLFDGTKFTASKFGKWASWGKEYNDYGRLVCDFDGDEKVDVAAPNEDFPDPPTYGIHLQTGSSNKIPFDVGIGGAAYCGDWDGDKRNDVAFGVESEDKSKITISVSLQTSPGQWSTPSAAYETRIPVDDDGLNAYEFQVGDFDGNGKSDLFFTQDAAHMGTVLLSDGGDFKEGPVLTVTEEDVNYKQRSLAVGDNSQLRGVTADVDGDGTDEWVFLGKYGWYDVYRLGDKKWSAVQQTTEVIQSFAWADAVASDVNGDHFDDVVAVAMTGHPAIFLGSPKGLQPGKMTERLFKNETDYIACLMTVASEC